MMNDDCRMIVFCLFLLSIDMYISSREDLNLFIFLQKINAIKRNRSIFIDLFKCSDFAMINNYWNR